jgi:glycosyltransferase involved in cell wall biosynthesis
VVGIPGPDTRKIEAEIRKARLSRKVLLFSDLSDSELRWCYENCETLLAPSSLEGFGLPIAEAVLAGARVVCSDIPAFRELGREACHYVAATDDPVSAYVRAIRQALAAPPPRHASLPQLTAVSVARRYVHLYRELASSPMTQLQRSCERVGRAPKPLGIRRK